MFNLFELFSGIGSQARALKNIGFDVNIAGTCEWDLHAFIAYDLFHNPSYIHHPEAAAKNKKEILDYFSDSVLSNNGKSEIDKKTLQSYSEDVLKMALSSVLRNRNCIDICGLSGENLPENIDLVTYSFPCQDLSAGGAFHGYNKGIDQNSGSRSSLLWQVGRVLDEIRKADKKMPRYLLMENVPMLLADRHYDNFKVWISTLEELGYISKYFQLNASSFGLPQNRQRLLMLSVYAGRNNLKRRMINNFFSVKFENDVIIDYLNSPYYRPQKVQELLRTNYSIPALWDEALQSTPNDTESRRKIWDENPKLVLPGGEYNKKERVVRTITTKQDRNPNSGNLFFESGIKGKSSFRYLTARECLLFMGFTDSDYDKLIANNPKTLGNGVLFPRDKIIRMAGNSIPVQLLEGIFLQLKNLEYLLYD